MIVVLSVLAMVDCTKKDSKSPVEAVFKESPVVNPVSPSFPGEVSGMADSYSRQGFIWLLQDSDNPAELLTLSQTGQQGPIVKINGAINRDWEDMVIADGPVPAKKYIYIADVGDNFGVFNNYIIYRVLEPDVSQTESEVPDKISFVYSDGKHHNTEAVFVAPETKDIYLVTKEIPSSVFVLSYPYSTGSVNTAIKKATLLQSTITGAAISPDGKELLLRTYSALYFWKRNSGQDILVTLLEQAKEIPVVSEPQGEAITFSINNSGFFTFSENAGLPIQLNLYFYPRN